MTRAHIDLSWKRMTDEELIELSKNFTSRTQLAKSFGYKTLTNAFQKRLKALGIEYKGTDLPSVTKEEFQSAVSGAKSITEVIKNLGKEKTKYRAYYNYVKKLSIEYEIPLPQFDYSTATKQANNFNTIPDEEYFAKDTLRNGTATRKRLIKKGWKYACSIQGCPLSENVVIVGEQVVWNEQLLTLQVDHIDGEHLNNEITNLRFLCPNCHAASDTYAGRKKLSEVKKPENFCPCGQVISKASSLCLKCEGKRRVGIYSIEYPSLEEMITKIEEMGFSAYSRDLGVSDNAIRKHLRRCGVDPLPRKVHRAKTCVDCSKKVSRGGAVRCPECAVKFRYDKA